MTTAHDIASDWMTTSLAERVRSLRCDHHLPLRRIGALYRQDIPSIRAPDSVLGLLLCVVAGDLLGFSFLTPAR